MRAGCPRPSRARRPCRSGWRATGPWSPLELSMSCRRGSTSRLMTASSGATSGPTRRGTCRSTTSCARSPPTEQARHRRHPLRHRTDGTLGLKRSRARAASPSRRTESPRSTTACRAAPSPTGCVDFVLCRPSEIAARARAHRAGTPTSSAATVPTARGGRRPCSSSEIFALAARRAPASTSRHYKRTHDRARASQRRMALHKVDGARDYVTLLQEHPGEVADALPGHADQRHQLLPRPRGLRGAQDTRVPRRSSRSTRDSASRIRVWVPGCSTGEEAYSIAIACSSSSASGADHAADPDLRAPTSATPRIEQARAGVYLENIALDVSPERLRRFFVKTDGGYQISKAIRDMCVFARQNVTARPAVLAAGPDQLPQRAHLPGARCCRSRSCRSSTTRCSPAGFLMLGTPRPSARPRDLFSLGRPQATRSTPRRPSRPAALLDFGLPASARRPRRSRRGGAAGRAAASDLHASEADRMVLAATRPPGVVVNEDLRDPPVPRPHRAVPRAAPRATPASTCCKMAREGLLVELRAALHRRKTERRPRAQGRAALPAGRARRARSNLEVIPLRTSAGRHGLLLPRALRGADREPKPRALAAPTAGRGRQAAATHATHRASSQQRARRRPRSTCRSIIEEHEATNEELQSRQRGDPVQQRGAAEHQRGAETAKEELQSTNEELTTVNEELQNRNAELGRLNNDLDNLLGEHRHRRSSCWAATCASAASRRGGEAAQPHPGRRRPPARRHQAQPRRARTWTAVARGDASASRRRAGGARQRRATGTRCGCAPTGTSSTRLTAP